MKRLVYTPSIHAWVKTDTGVFDLSPYITDFNVDRRVNQTSYAEITFRNPKDKNGNFVFTETQGIDGSVRPMFHPMDPIIITLTRLKGRPVQVFTGYCDTTPYVQLQPGLARLTASCTLKRLLYTYWDPALPFVRDFMAQNGWGIAADGTSFNSTAEGASQIVTKNGQTELVSGKLNDTSIGKLLYRLLIDVGRWDPGNVYIQELPASNITQLVTNLYKDTVNEEASSIDQFHEFLKQVLGSGAYGKAGAVVTGPDGKPLVAPSQQDIDAYKKMLSGGIKPISNNSEQPHPSLARILTKTDYNKVQNYLSLKEMYISPLHKEAFGNPSKWEKQYNDGSGVFIPVNVSDWDGVTDVHLGVKAIGPGKIVKVGELPNSGINYGKTSIVQKLDKPIKVDGKPYFYIYYGNISNKIVTDNNHLLDKPLIAKTGYNVVAGETIGTIAENKSQQTNSSLRTGAGSGLYIGLAEDANGTFTTDTNKSQKLYDVMQGLLASASYTKGGYLDPSNAGYPVPVPFDASESATTEQTATAAAFSSYFQMPGMMEMQEAVALTGKRSLLNDKPLFSFVEQVAAGSLRSFMSMPNGNFYAFYPDYFGGLGRNPYWEIKDIEIMSGGIELSDDALATHVFVVGDTQPSGGPLGYGTIDWIDKINTAGVVNVLNAFAADFINGPPDPAKPNAYASAGGSLSDKGNAINFLKKYGARPVTEEMPVIRSPIYETFVAYQRFCLLWSQQFKTTFEFTFMPELYPGGIVAFPEHGLQCYVDTVTHTGSYESGFRTVASLIAPSALKDGSGNPIDSKKSWVHNGMIRAFSFNADNLAHPVSSYNSSASNPKPKNGG